LRADARGRQPGRRLLDRDPAEARYWIVALATLPNRSVICTVTADALFAIDTPPLPSVVAVEVASVPPLPSLSTTVPCRLPTGPGMFEFATMSISRQPFCAHHFAVALIVPERVALATRPPGTTWNGSLSM